MTLKSVFSANNFKLNPDKTEFILFASRNVHAELSEVFPANTLDNLLSPDVVRNLGVWFDSDLSFNTTTYQVIAYHSCKKESSLVGYQASLCFQDNPIGVQVST